MKSDLLLASHIRLLHISYAVMMTFIETLQGTCIKYWGSPGTCCTFIRLNQNQSWNPFQKRGWIFKMNQRRSHWERPCYRCPLLFKNHADWNRQSDRNRFCTSITWMNMESVQCHKRPGFAKMHCNPSDLLNEVWAYYRKRCCGTKLITFYYLCIGFVNMFQLSLPCKQGNSWFNVDPMNC